jgi:hypothetical protein
VRKRERERERTTTAKTNETNTDTNNFAGQNHCGDNTILNIDNENEKPKQGFQE